MLVISVKWLARGAMPRVFAVAGQSSPLSRLGRDEERGGRRPGCGILSTNH